ncbi:MAG: tRNA threonylcarbamoyladenosine dehydratase [Treponema sp.]|nr:tRNA threonylcarbamoyladenosine dehydratase [Treponema sp.]
MAEQFARSALVFGEEGIARLRKRRVAVFGLGGVGGAAAEALVRGGIGAVDLIDSDIVSLTNLNRQIIATRRTVGMYKTDAARERLLDICPDTDIRTYKVFFTPENQDEFDFSQYDYVIDAIDTVAGKIALAEKAEKSGTRIISCMGAGNKTDICSLAVADIFDTSICPLARTMRRELKKRGIRALKAVFSTEVPVKAHITDGAELQEKGTAGRPAPGSTSFVPPAAGLVMAGEVIKELSGFYG